MLQPFVRFEKKFIPRLVSLKETLLVTQSYERAYDHFAGEHKIDILITTYSDIGLAKVHLNAVKKDKYASIIDLKKEPHYDKLMEMLSPNSKYALFWSVINSTQELKKRLDLKYTDNIRRWIDKNTTWKIGRGEVIRPVPQLIFGELFIIIKRGNEERRVKFADIEKS